VLDIRSKFYSKNVDPEMKRDPNEVNKATHTAVIIIESTIQARKLVFQVTS
jgi:hypothetical protein